ncbi:hypothetical protein AB0O07_23450 [Streptomyces sp. NPDC093085]|uniref:hypothetical protein n=1 Tax=Streptomyces sp. NPDC093085 TaxID=3155068 RepID=UPI00341CC7E8
MTEQHAIDRAEEIIQQAVEGMSPKPTLERVGPVPVGACIARDDHGPDDRVQVSIAYILKGVPSTEAEKLVRQARDAWLKKGHEYTSGVDDWDTHFPAVYMRTKSDDFRMNALTGVVDRAKGEGQASLGVTSPCFMPPATPTPSTTADPAALVTPETSPEASQQAGGSAGRRALAYSSRIYDALRVKAAPTQPGEGLRTVREETGTLVQHTWSSEPLPEGGMVRALERGGAYLRGEGWKVGGIPTAAGIPALVALHPSEGTTVQLAPSTTGSLRVGVTTPADEPQGQGQGQGQGPGPATVLS